MNNIEEKKDEFVFHASRVRGLSDCDYILNKYKKGPTVKAAESIASMPHMVQTLIPVGYQKWLSAGSVIWCGEMTPIPPASLYAHLDSGYKALITAHREAAREAMLIEGDMTND